MFNNLYQDIGKKIKSLAKGLFVVEAIAAVVGGSIYGASGDEFDFFVGIIIIFSGIICAYVSSMFLYGFGEVIDKLTCIESNTRGDVKTNNISNDADDVNDNNNTTVYGNSDAHKSKEDNNCDDSVWSLWKND